MAHWAALISVSVALRARHQLILQHRGWAANRIQLTKKGDLPECSNWRGTTLLSVAGKVYARILLNRMKDVVDQLLHHQHCKHSRWKKTTLAWSRAVDGPPAHSTASTTPGGSRLREGTGSTKDKLERRSQEGSAKNGTHMGGRRGGSSQQIRMASSECGLIRLYGRGMNQGPKHVSMIPIYNASQ